MFLLVALIAVVSLLVVFLLSGVGSPGADLSASNIQPISPQYLSVSSGDVSKIFLLSAEPRYGYWTLNDTHMDWLSSGPVIHEGDPVIVVNATVRNDYTQNDPAGAVSRVDSQNRSSVGFTVTLFDKNNNVVDALQAYPRTETLLNVSFFSLQSGEPASFELYFATGNRSIDHYEIIVAYVSSVPHP